MKSTCKIPNEHKHLEQYNFICWKNVCKVHTGVYLAYTLANLLLVEQGWFCHNANTVDFQMKNVPAKRGLKK